MIISEYQMLTFFIISLLYILYKSHNIKEIIKHKNKNRNKEQILYTYKYDHKYPRYYRTMI